MVMTPNDKIAEAAVALIERAPRPIDAHASFWKLWDELVRVSDQAKHDAELDAAMREVMELRAKVKELTTKADAYEAWTAMHRGKRR
jgi:hypothetical protein